jgi:hypothetical protein
VLSEAWWPVLRGVPHVRHGKNNPASRPVGLAGWYRSRAVAVALGHRAERPLITIVHCQYAPRAGCSALRPGTTFLRRSRARVRCASVSPPSRPRHRPPRADPARSAVFRPFNRGRLSSPVKLPVPGSGSFPRSAPHECVREWAPQRVERSVKISPSAESPRSPSLPFRQGQRPAPLMRQAGFECFYAALFSFPHSKLVSSVQMQCRMTAILRATATLAFLAPTRFISRMPQAFRADQCCVR